MKSLQTVLGGVFLAAAMSFQTCMAQNTETRSLKDFSGVSFSGAYEVTLKNSSETKIEITGSDDVPSSDIITEIKGNMLDVRFKDGHKSRNIRKTPQIVLHYKNLDCIENSGAVNIKNEGVLKSNSLKIDISGAGNMKLNLETEKLKVDMSGAAKLSLEGSAANQDYDLSGACNIHAYDLVGQNVKLDISGAGNAKVHAKKSLEADVSGVGNVRYRGNPSQVKASDGMTSSIKAE